jgi:hypothetical protein
MRFALLIFPAALSMLTAPAFGAGQNIPQQGDTTLASAGPIQKTDGNASATPLDAADRTATGAPQRLSPLAGDGETAWSHVGQPLPRWKHK